MLKKVINIILSLMLLISTTGITISKHYCGSTLKSVSIVTEPESCCDIPAGCCHNESFSVKVEDNFIAISIPEIDTPVAQDMPAITQSIFITEIVLVNDYVYADTPPPPDLSTFLSSVQVFLL